MRKNSLSDMELENLIRRALKAEEKQAVKQYCEAYNYKPSRDELKRAHRLYEAKRDASYKPKRDGKKPVMLAALAVAAACLIIIALKLPSFNSHYDFTVGGNQNENTFAGAYGSTDNAIVSPSETSFEAMGTSTPSSESSLETSSSEEAPASVMNAAYTADPSPTMTISPTPAYTLNVASSPTPPDDTDTLAENDSEREYVFVLINNTRYTISELYLWQGEYEIGANRLSSFLSSGESVKVNLSEYDILRRGKFGIRIVYNRARWQWSLEYPYTVSEWNDIYISSLIDRNLVIYEDDAGLARYKTE